MFTPKHVPDGQKKIFLITNVHLFRVLQFSYLDVVVLMISSTVRFQFFRFPLIKPAMMTNSSTSTFTAVKILLTIADSFTPKARTPEKGSDSRYQNTSEHSEYFYLDNNHYSHLKKTLMFIFDYILNLFQIDIVINTELYIIIRKKMFSYFVFN